MMKFIILLFYCLGVPLLLNAQASYQNVIAADGGTAQTKTMTLDWTLGEPVIESARTVNHWYTQGFQQPILTVKDMEPGLYPYLSPRYEESDITVAPNPVTTTLTMTMKNFTENEIEIQISNFAGQLVKSETINPTMGKTQLDFSSMVPGLYVLRVYNAERQLLKVFKVAKFQ
ncbi:MAG TPA: T9SS type A sorting domain-containing protein [Saprospiraceae bacterium]|nr:T9SS type A sorting domain-containing protein [Saprospiraceae bacterium]